LPSLDSEHLRLLFTFGLTSWVLQVSGQIMRYSDSIVIGALLPVGFVAYFAIAASLTEYARSMISSVSGVLTPLTTTLQARGDERALRDSLMASTRLTTMLVLPVAATFFLRGRSFIGLWMGPAYRDLSGRVLQILAIALAGQAAFHVVTATMIGINRHRGLIPVFALDAICNIALSIYLVRALGVVGSAIGTLVPQLVVTTVVAPWYVRRVMGIPMRQYWFNALLRPLAAIVPFVVGSYLVERLWATSRLPLFLAQVALTLPLAAAGAWLVAVTRDERRSIMSLFDGRGLTPARGTT
jgi:O-antigen/teichoic acid export membrane protein